MPDVCFLNAASLNLRFYGKLRKLTGLEGGKHLFIRSFAEIWQDHNYHKMTRTSPAANNQQHQHQPQAPASRLLHPAQPAAEKTATHVFLPTSNKEVQQGFNFLQDKTSWVFPRKLTPYFFSFCCHHQEASRCPTWHKKTPQPLENPVQTREKRWATGSLTSEVSRRKILLSFSRLPTCMEWISMAPPTFKSQPSYHQDHPQIVSYNCCHHCHHHHRHHILPSAEEKNPPIQYHELPPPPHQASCLHPWLGVHSWLQKARKESVWDHGLLCNQHASQQWAYQQGDNHQANVWSQGL